MPLSRSLRRPFREHAPCRACAFIIALLLPLLITTQASAQAAATTDDQPSVIRGTVVNRLTGAAIPRALVFSPDSRYAMFTDGDGHFSFTIPRDETAASANNGKSNGSISLFARVGGVRRASNLFMARKPGFLDDHRSQRRAEVSADGELTISLSPESLIKGRITSATGEPVAAANIQLFARQIQDGLPRWNPRGSARSNSAGEFRFADLESGTYKLATSEWMDNDPLTSIPGGPKFGSPPVYFPNAADSAAAGAIELSAGQIFQADLSLSRQRYFDVKIPIANEEFEGGLMVKVEGQRGPGYSLGYNTNTRKIEGWLPDGSYTLRASTFGAGSATGTLGIKVNGAPVTGPAMGLIRNGTIGLNVKEDFRPEQYPSEATWSDGTHSFSYRGPRLYLNVWAEPADEVDTTRAGSVRPPMRDNDDSLVIENLPPGRYWLHLDPSRGYAESATSGGVDVLHQPVVVGPGSNLTVDVQMRDDFAEIDGTLSAVSSPAAAAMDSSSGPAAWVYCIPLADSAGRFEQIPVFSEGKFSANTIPPGDYLLLAFSTRQPNLPYRDPEAMSAWQSKGQVVHVTAGQKTSVQLQNILTGD